MRQPPQRPSSQVILAANALLGAALVGLVLSLDVMRAVLRRP